MADDLRLGQGIDPGKVLLPLLLQSLLTGKRIDIREILASVLTGKPVVTPMPVTAAMPIPTPVPTPVPQPSSAQLGDLSTILLPLLYERLTGKPLPGETQTAPEKPLTPVNGALGQTVGKLLNGRKTGIGIAGLLATTLLPVFFPQFAPVLEVVKTVGGAAGEVVTGATGEAVKEMVKQGPMGLQTWGGSIVEVAKPVFAALTGWGVLGKLDKWFRKVPQS